MERRAELTSLRRWAAAALLALAALAPSAGVAQQDEQLDDGAVQPRFQDDGDRRFHHQQRHRGSDMPVPQSGGTRPYWGTQQPYWGTMGPYWGPSGAPPQQLHGTTPLNRRGR